jgi:outer membrane protein OmpA-like peptidoglycan-associated protein
MLKRTLFSFSFVFYFVSAFAQTGTTSKTLLKADKLFINLAYADAVESYVKYLKKNPKDYYASRQAAICYTKLNDMNSAVDYWRDASDNAAATPKDNLEYAKSLLANNRIQEAKVIFANLRASNDAYLASWGKAFGEGSDLFSDAELTKVIELKGVNTDKAEFSPALYKDNIVYVTEPKSDRPIRRISAWSNEKFYIWKSATKRDSTNFSDATDFNAHVQSKFFDGPLCFTADGLKVYFTRSASLKEKSKTAGNSDMPVKEQIFISEMNSFGNAHPEIKPFVYNSHDYNCMHPSLSKDGKRLYFVSDMPGTLGGMDIFVCEWDKDAWGKPLNCGPEVNSPGNEVFPFISDEGTLYFSSDYRPGIGGMDIFSADAWPNKDKLFFQAENLGIDINSKSDDFGAIVMDNGKKGYLSSNRKNQMRDDDIYYFINNKPKSMPVKIKFVDTLNNKDAGVTTFTITTKNGNVIAARLDSGYFTTRLKENQEVTIATESENYKSKLFVKTITKEDSILEITVSPKVQNCVKGVILDKDDNKPVFGLKVAVYDEDGNRYYDALTDSSGRYQVCNLPANKALYIGTEKKPDYFTNTERFNMPGEKQDIEKNIFALKLVVGKAIRVDNIYFDLGKSNIRDDAAKELDKLVQLMKDNPEVIIELSSHTDCRGNAKVNLMLSDKRAKSSAAYLVSKGVAKSRVKGKGYGESRLLNDCACEGKKQSACSEEQHAQNRRSEFKVTGFVPEKKPETVKNGSKKSRKKTKK